MTNIAPTMSVEPLRHLLALRPLRPLRPPQLLRPLPRSWHPAAAVLSPPHHLRHLRLLLRRPPQTAAAGVVVVGGGERDFWMPFAPGQRPKRRNQTRLESPLRVLRQWAGGRGCWRRSAVEANQAAVAGGSQRRAGRTDRHPRRRHRRQSLRSTRKAASRGVCGPQCLASHGSGHRNCGSAAPWTKTMSYTRRRRRLGADRSWGDALRIIALWCGLGGQLRLFRKGM